MGVVNIELKARSDNHDKIRAVLQQKGADFRGTDHQIDTYFEVPFGRLKLREGRIENNLIHYNRSNKKGPKQADIILFKSSRESSLKSILTTALKTWLVVDKTREIYFIDNVKFHLDQVKDLGTFKEIEAIDTDGSIGIEKLREQCEAYQTLFNVHQEDLVAVSYSDMMADHL